MKYSAFTVIWLLFFAFLSSSCGSSVSFPVTPTATQSVIIETTQDTQALTLITQSPTSGIVPTLIPTEIQMTQAATLKPTIEPIAPAATLTPKLTVTNTPTNPRYVFPVRAQQYSYGPYHHDYPAADIFCPVGSEFVAPTDGVVDFVSYEDLWQPSTNRPEHRGGLSVAIIGNDGVRYYGSHLSKVEDDIKPGVRVVAGQILGLTGASGNARGTDPHLHFGISRPTTPDDWAIRRGEVSPYLYLRAWEKGENITPDLPLITRLDGSMS